MPSIKEDWARAFAAQALSDLVAREALVNTGVEKCHRLHFLQMAAEKTCKAYLIAVGGKEAANNSHDYVKKVLPTIAKVFYAGQNSNGSIQSWQLERIKRFAREINLLSPACTEEHSREDNSEYPWLDAQGNVQTPCEYSFPNINDSDKGIVQLIKLIRAAAETYAN